MEPMDTSDIPPHEVEQPMQAMIPRPIEASAVHFRAHGRCYAAMVVDVDSDDPLSPEFTVDLVVFAPRDKQRKDRFTDVGRLPGSTRWANGLIAALPDENGDWAETTWHFPGHHCLPRVVLDGASRD